MEHSREQAVVFEFNENEDFCDHRRASDDIRLILIVPELRVGFVSSFGDVVFGKGFSSSDFSSQK